MSSRHARRISTPLPYLGKLTLSAGVITDVTRLAGVEGDGATYPASRVGVWPAATNLVTQSIPGALATTGVTKAGDAAATLTKIADSTHPFPNATADVWCLDNSAGAGDATVDFDGNATAVAHTASIWAYKTAGSPNLSIEGTSPTAISGATWARYTNTKTATAGDNLRITAPAGAVVYFVAAQLETGSIATPYIETDGGTASRVAGRIQVPWAGLLTPEQGWVAARCYMPWKTAPNNAPTLFAFGDATNDLVMLFAGTGTSTLQSDSPGGAAAASATSSSEWSAGDDVLYVGAWETAALKASHKGVAFTSAARSEYPTISDANADIGTRGTLLAGRESNVAFYWAAFGKGTLTDADVALFHAWGNNDPLPHMFPRSAQLTFLARFNGDGTLYRYAA